MRKLITTVLIFIAIWLLTQAVGFATLMYTISS